MSSRFSGGGVSSSSVMRSSVDVSISSGCFVCVVVSGWFVCVTVQADDFEVNFMLGDRRN